ncbi:MAG: glycosyltransferase family 1 protein [Clostridia bacterium]|nr:glycosyltransferase family 1 protein [Clostridia bacterium]
MRPKLLYFITEDWFFCSHFLGRAKAALSAGHDVVVVARERSHGNAIRKQGLKFIPFPISRRGLNPFRELLTILRLISIYRREHPDVVHHIALKPIMYGTIAALFCGCRKIVNAPVGLGFVFSSGSWKARLLRPFAGLGLQFLLNPRGSRVIFENQDDVRAFVGARIVRPQDAILIRGAGVDTREFAVAPEPDGSPVIILVARMLWDKGIGEYVEAAQILKARGRLVRMLLVGAPDDQNPASIPIKTLNEWNASGVVEWLGHRNDIPKLLGQSHIVCLPSYREGLPKSLLEGLAAGRPLVTTDVPGCREAVQDGANGFLVPAKDARSLADALEKLILNHELRRKMGTASRNLALTDFSSQRIEAETLAVYFRFLGKETTLQK